MLTHRDASETPDTAVSGSGQPFNWVPARSSSQRQAGEHAGHRMRPLGATSDSGERCGACTLFDGRRPALVVLLALVVLQLLAHRETSRRP